MTNDNHDYETYERTLEGIDTLAYNLLEEAKTDDSLEPAHRQRMIHQLRQTRAAIDPLLLWVDRMTEETNE